MCEKYGCFFGERRVAYELYVHVGAIELFVGL